MDLDHLTSDVVHTLSKSPDDTEMDTPTHTHIQCVRPLSFTNGGAAVKNPDATLPEVVVTYKECMKNHAAILGGHAVDGCGEFMPSPTVTDTNDPTSIKCAACGCHRNFHRREPGSPTTITAPFLDFRQPNNFLPKRSIPFSPASPPTLPPPRYAPHMLLALSTAVASEDIHQAPVTPTADNPVGRKRFRTKFSQEQKEKMQSFSEKIGWKMQKCDETEVEEFCRETGVTKGVLRVWMHNNKNTIVKKEIINGSINMNTRLIDQP